MASEAIFRGKKVILKASNCFKSFVASFFCWFLEFSEILDVDIIPGGSGTPRNGNFGGSGTLENDDFGGSGTPNFGGSGTPRNDDFRTLGAKMSRLGRPAEATHARDILQEKDIS